MLGNIGLRTGWRKLPQDGWQRRLSMP